MKNIWQFLGLTQERIGRRRFLIAFFSAQWGLPLAFLLVTGLFYLVFGEDSPILFLPAILFFASLIFGFVVYIKICIRRVRDIGIARSWWVLAIIPFINIPFFIYLCLKKGTTRQLTDDSRTNPFTQQFKSFFAKSYSKPFIVICLVVIVLGIISSLYTISNLKDGIFAQITTRKAELNRIYDEQDKKADVERQELLKKSNECWEDFKNRALYDVDSLSNSEKYVTRNRICERVPSAHYVIRVEYQYLKDETYKELTHINNTPSLQLFFEKLGFGWWGIVALVAVLFMNILIVFFKLFAKYAPIVIGAGGAQATLTKTNIRNMPAFQRYLLLIALLTLITLVLVFIKL